MTETLDRWLDINDCEGLNGRFQVWLEKFEDGSRCHTARFYKGRAMEVSGLMAFNRSRITHVRALPRGPNGEIATEK